MRNKLCVSDTRDYFMKDGKGFFYLADTVWSAFTNASFEEWEEYLDYRRLQGFNVLQINILPQWDASESDIQIEAFHSKADGKPDFFGYDGEYFKRAAAMLEMAVNKGFTPALVVLWCNFVKDTWASKRMPDNIMPLEAVRPFTEYTVKTFSRFNPIYLISGDTDFQTEESRTYYMEALKTVKELCPEAVTTLHIGGNRSDLPQAFVESPLLDFYMYQSGHRVENEDGPYRLAKEFLSKSVKKPIVNGEPCYEGHGFGNRYGRFNAFHIRKATWQSLLSGAKAGITYGAHGVWSWHKKNKGFGSTAFSGVPYDWRTALHFEGAWDAAFAKWVFETYGLFDLEPSENMENPPEGVKMAVAPSQSKVAVYAPYGTDISIPMDLSGYEWTLISLEDKYFAKPELEVTGGRSTVKMRCFNSDVLIIGIK